jgi:hypothetical protein
VRTRRSITRCVEGLAWLAGRSIQLQAAHIRLHLAVVCLQCKRLPSGCRQAAVSDPALPRQETQFSSGSREHTVDQADLHGVCLLQLVGANPQVGAVKLSMVKSDPLAGAVWVCSALADRLADATPRRPYHRKPSSLPHFPLHFAKSHYSSRSPAN